MKRLLTVLALITSAVFLNAFVDKGTYVLEGTSDIKEGFAVLTIQARSDTVLVREGRFAFKGTVTGHTAGLILVSGGNGVPAPVIIEPGKIIVKVQGDFYNLGGTETNIGLQKMQQQLVPYKQLLSKLRKSSYELRGKEQKKIFSAIDSINASRVKVATELVSKSSGYAGLVLLSSYYQNFTAGSLESALGKFKAFSADPVYKRIEIYYGSMPKADVGLMAPVFTLQDPQGKMVSLLNFRRKYVLLDFWFNNCVFCRKMSPHLKKVYKDFKDKDFEIISISVDLKDQETDWRLAMKEDGTTWTQLWDYDQTLPSVYSVKGYPSMFLLDKQGVIVEKIYGYHDEAFFRKLLAKYIN